MFNRDRRWWTIAAAIGSIAGFFLCVWLEPGGESTSAAVSDFASPAAGFAAAVACLYAGRRTRGRIRLGWTLFGLGMFSTASGDAIWSFYDLVLGHEPPAVSVADIAYLAQVPLTLAAIIALLGAQHRGDTLRAVLDGLIIGGSFLYISWATVLGPAFHAGDLGPLEWTVTLAYPLGDVATASMVFLLLSHVDRRLRASLLLAGAGLVALTFADSAFAYLAEKGSYSSGDVLDTAWFAAFVLMGLAGLRAADPDRDTKTAQDPWRRVVLPYVPLVVALVTSVVLEVRGAVGVFLYATSLALVVLVVARQVVTLRENVTLTRQLETSLAGLREREEQLRHLAFHDPLTGLANRALFQDRVEHAIASQERDRSAIGVLYVDLDGFKGVNDSMGHGAGDALLTTIGQRLQSCARPSDTVARLGGDEFAILVEHLGHATAATKLAQRVVEMLGQPVLVGGVSVQVGASVGVAVREAGAERKGEVLREADCAMYAAKLQGKGRHVMFEPAMRSAFSIASAA